jgi:exodeoxyribonuclease V alpha subunit
VHQLLGLSRLRSQSKGERPLNVTHLFIDEASMLDLKLFAQLLSALPPSARLTLVGDPDQLPAIEVGSVLPALLEAADRSPADALPILSATRLSQTFRFADGGNIAAQADAVKQGRFDWHGAVNRGAIQPLTNDASALIQAFFSPYIEQLKLEQTAIQPEALVDAFESKRILTPYLEGSFGVRMINQLIEALLESQDLKRPGQAHYHGQPILVVENDHHQGLANGDLGICIDTERVSGWGNSYTERYQVAFRGPEALRYLPVSLLPKFETSFGMSIHKSQGSEYSDVLLLVPNRDAPQAGHILSRQLIYTAITRAKENLNILADEAAWQRAQRTSIFRRTTLTERILDAIAMDTEARL